jgi:type II secretory pathway pseudopilin PulG
MGLLETMMVAILISVFMVVFMSRILNVSVAVEREAMQQTVNNLNSALNIEALVLVVQNNEEAIAAWEGANPMRLLDPKPIQYKGSFSEPDAMQQKPGSWYFDESQSLLIYRINNIEQFGGGRAMPERVRFRVVPQFNDQNKNGIKENNERYIGLKLQALDKYQWLPERNGEG